MRLLLTILLITIFATCGNWSQLKYELKCEPYLIQLSYDSLLAQVGIKEATGHNDGAVQKYQNQFGVSRKPYCQMLQYWCFSVNAKQKSDIPIPKSALAISSYNYAKKKGYAVSYEPAIHDLLVYQNSGDVTGHVERIIETGESGWVTVIAGNTSNGKTGNQREGNGVYKRERNIYHPLSRILLIKGLVGFIPIGNTAEKQGCNVK
jgi:hypothetical protein